MIDQQWHLQFKQAAEDERSALWRQGDLILELEQTDEIYKEVAQIHGIKIATLKERAKVANMFPRDERNESIAYGIYRHLAKIPDADVRQAIFNQRTPEEWTADAMDDAVKSWILEQRQQQGIEQKMLRAGCRLPDGTVGVVVEKVHGIVKVTIDGGLSEEQMLNTGAQIIVTGRE